MPSLSYWPECLMNTAPSIQSCSPLSGKPSRTPKLSTTHSTHSWRASMSSPLDEFLKAHEKEQDALQKALEEITESERERLKEVLEIHAQETQRTLDLLAEGERG